eukprot:GHVS01107741.1.p1 GENE.GHVS01107741.1~~GHVS01107741.1.p1  ORF type:complete len:135 (+),score=26.10 GHVS01107741.1:427-831(+)
MAAVCSSATSAVVSAGGQAMVLVSNAVAVEATTIEQLLLKYPNSVYTSCRTMNGPYQLYELPKHAMRLSHNHNHITTTRSQPPLTTTLVVVVDISESSAINKIMNQLNNNSKAGPATKTITEGSRQRYMDVVNR